MDKKIMLMQGNEACVEGALAAGMRFFAGYPNTFHLNSGNISKSS